jgi:hypothetical protein
VRVRASARGGGQPPRDRQHRDRYQNCRRHSTL